MSTGMLTRHLKKFHREEYNSMVELQTTKKHKVDSVDLSQVSLSKFLVGAPSFEGALLSWMIDMYQPISACEHPSFRAMVQSLNPKAQVVGREKLKAMIAKQYTLVKLKFKSILKGIPFSCTTDAWTSCSNVTYMTCTVHFIDRSTWQLNRFSLGIFEKTGSSKAEDVVSYVEKMWSQFDLEYSSCTAIVTDTEATMCKAGRLFCQAASRNGGDLAWHGCVDHLLELVTGVALKDYPESAGAMQAARDLVSFFSSSSQASDTLLSLQRTGRPVKCIQDVATRWWSTYSMCHRLIRLRPYLNLMEAEGSLKKNLSADHWSIIVDTCAVLEPFMFAQKLLEGETYVTISLVPYLIFKIRKGLQSLLDAPDNQTSVQIRALARKMMYKFECNWGSGEPGTVATEYISLGPNQ